MAEYWLKIDWDVVSSVSSEPVESVQLPPQFHEF